MKRREFMALLGGAATWPQTLLAQTPRQRPLVGVLLYGPLQNFRTFPVWAALLEGMRERGQIEGRTFDIVLRSADGRPEGVHRRPAEWVAHARCATDCVAPSCARPASLQNQTTMLGQMVTSGHFSDENEVGRSMELLISARIGPSRSLAERRDIHSWSTTNALHFISRSASDSQASM